jgi:hypothetical protein
LSTTAPADNNGRTKQEQPVNKKNPQPVPNLTFHPLDVNKSRTKRARNVNNARTVFVPFFIVALTMTGVVFLQAHQLYRQMPTEPTITVADSVLLGETDTSFSFVKTFTSDTSFAFA